ncbi:hypothetical protein BS47DRAFT_1335897 [Hydnum rufescens UP504]|uniref:Uncharacterized protein n=1 Tax=Hydnum rufescens UP504 TaxID=1448309 RepID=A0A9P6E225_9AGAM|nr:hypothetical protein BS47DRAFT_1335897 [Hydnum rufescens UP504]
MHPTCYAFESTAVAPCIILEITELVNSYMIWVGSTESDLSSSDRSTIEQQIALGRLANDWACAMPPLGPDKPSVGTSLYRSSSTDLVRFRKQIFLSVDVTTSFGNPSDLNHVLLEMERNVAKTLKALQDGPRGLIIE